jgi:hypothetical protein
MSATTRLYAVNKRPRVPPSPLGRSIASVADRRRDPRPINNSSCGYGRNQDRSSMTDLVRILQTYDQDPYGRS